MPGERREDYGARMSLWERLPVPPQHVVPMAVAALVPRTRRLPRRLVTPGLALVCAGATLNLWAMAVRRFEDLEHPAELTSSGPYAVTRNPMYVGWTLMHLGTGLAARSPWVLLSWCYPARLIHPEVLREEQQLRVLFGDVFEDYVRRVPRYAGLTVRAAPCR